MNPPAGAKAPQDLINEMYEFLAFEEALDDGLSVEALIEERAAQGQANIARRVNELISQLQELIEMNEHERKQLVADARGLTPNEARDYCEQLTVRVNELKQTTTNQQKQFEKAEIETREQKEQNVSLVDSIKYLKNSLQRSKESQSYLQEQLNATGSAFCQYIANPTQYQRKENESGKYSRGTTGPNGQRF